MADYIFPFEKLDVRQLAVDLQSLSSVCSKTFLEINIFAWLVRWKPR